MGNRCGLLISPRYEGKCEMESEWQLTCIQVRVPSGGAEEAVQEPPL